MSSEPRSGRTRWSVRLSFRRLRLLVGMDSADSEINVASGFALALLERVFLALLESEVVENPGCEEQGSAPGEASSFVEAGSASGVGLDVDAM